MVLGWAPMVGPRLFCAKEDTGGILWVTSVCGCPKITPNAAASRKRLYPESGCIPKAAASQKSCVLTMQPPMQAECRLLWCWEQHQEQAAGSRKQQQASAAGVGWQAATVDSNQTGSSTGCG